MEEVHGCTQNADGSLRDASEIPWYSDAIDEHPISGASSSSASSSAIPPILFSFKVFVPLTK
ncbi:hypothetical protein B0H19DRAFT_1093072 [Mycena capillaripes]|nr:hypothetical protein B0H19DRAFT_1093072 [Mycena capillaripes]